MISMPTEQQKFRLQLTRTQQSTRKARKRLRGIPFDRSREIPCTTWAVHS